MVLFYTFQTFCIILCSQILINRIGGTVYFMVFNATFNNISAFRDCDVQSNGLYVAIGRWNGSEIVRCAVINNPQFVDAIIPMVLDKILQAMRPYVEKIVNDGLQPYIETIEHTKTTVLAQETVIQQQNQTINNFTAKSTNWALE